MKSDNITEVCASQSVCNAVDAIYTDTKTVGNALSQSKHLGVEVAINNTASELIFQRHADAASVLAKVQILNADHDIALQE